MDYQEKWNFNTHLFGATLSILVFPYLIFLGINNNSKYALFSALIYGLSLVILYTSSTLYHYACLKNKEHLSKFRLLDHISIYYLIAGTYTPFTLILLKDQNGITIFWVVWSIAIFGTFFKLIFKHKFEALSLILYLIMGWLIVFDFSSLLEAASSKILWNLFLGGAGYTLGTVFYAVNKIPYNHSIWHLMVLAGSFFHLLAVIEILN